MRWLLVPLLGSLVVLAPGLRRQEEEQLQEAKTARGFRLFAPHGPKDRPQQKARPQAPRADRPRPAAQAQKQKPKAAAAKAPAQRRPRPVAPKAAARPQPPARPAAGGASEQQKPDRQLLTKRGGGVPYRPPPKRTHEQQKQWVHDTLAAEFFPDVWARYKRKAALTPAQKAFATYQDMVDQKWTDGSEALPVFKNVLLVVHCRYQAGDVEHVVCKEREKIFKRYAPHFGDVFWMTRANHCPGMPDDPHVCVANLMETRGAHRDGILYVHFDALISPQNLAVGFNKDAMASFGNDHACHLDDEEKLVDCHWANWHDVMRERWRTAVGHLGADTIDPHTIYMGPDDIFYMPRKAFSMYSKMARGFADAHAFHEVVGPTIRAVISRQLNISVVNMNCMGSCCAQLTAEDARNATFRCGHQFDLREPSVQAAFRAVL